MNKSYKLSILGVFLIAFLGFQIGGTIGGSIEILGSISNAMFSLLPGHPYSDKNVEADPLTDIHEKSIETEVPSELTTLLQSLPTSLQGTEIAGNLREDVTGQLIVDKDLRAFFDYFLSLRGETDEATIQQYFYQLINYKLGPVARQQAQAVLQDYLNYLAALKEVSLVAIEGENYKNKKLDSEMFKNRKAQIREIREQYLSPSIAGAFFQEEDEYDNYMFDMMAIKENPNLSDVEKLSQQSQLIQNLSPEFQHSIGLAEDYQQFLRNKLLSTGGDEEETYTLHERLFGREAADRLATLDMQRNQWRQLLRNYLLERQQLMANEALAEEERTAMVDDLRQQSFKQVQLQRVKQYEIWFDNGDVQAHGVVSDLYSDG